MAKTTAQFLDNMFEALSDAQYIQNKKHHGNTSLELESAPHKVGQVPYKGPIKKVPSPKTVKESEVEEGFIERNFTKKGRAHKHAAEILKSIKRKKEPEKTQKEDFSLKPKSENDKLARQTKLTNRPDTKKRTATKLTAMGKIHYRNGKMARGPEPEK